MKINHKIMYCVCIIHKDFSSLGVMNRSAAVIKVIAHLLEVCGGELNRFVRWEEERKES